MYICTVVVACPVLAKDVEQVFAVYFAVYSNIHVHSCRDTHHPPLQGPKAPFSNATHPTSSPIQTHISHRGAEIVAPTQPTLEKSQIQNTYAYAVHTTVDDVRVDSQLVKATRLQLQYIRSLCGGSGSKLMYYP